MLVVPGIVFKGYDWLFHPPPEMPHYVCRIIQTGPQRKPLATPYLAELMNLSADKPTLWKEFDAGQAEKQILRSPVIREARVKAAKPDTVYIDYTVRKPVALLADFENMAFDEEGVVFPLTPFFSPKKLPEVYLGIKRAQWGKEVSGHAMSLAQDLLKQLAAFPLPVKRLDVSKAFASSLGRREVVMEVEGRLLRLTPKNFAQEVGNYVELHKELSKEAHVIDLRIPQLAFIENNLPQG